MTGSEFAHERKATADRGVLTLGFGHERYRRMAKALARSIRIHNPELQLAVVTDDLDDPELARYFDKLVPLDPSYGSGLEHKLALDLYTPFEHTLFIDADCLVTKSLDHVFDLMGVVPFGVVGFPVVDGYYWDEVEDWKRRFGVPYIGKFNAGLMCFHGPQGRAVFETARGFIADGVTEGVPIYRGALLDEIFLAGAMAKCGLVPIFDQGRVMRAPEPLESPIFIDVADGVGRFRTKGTWVEPAVVHLAYLYHGPGIRGSVYRREIKRLLEERVTMRDRLQCLLAQTVFVFERSAAFRNVWKTRRGVIHRSAARLRLSSS
jgi:hypothetical protein